MRNVYTSSYNNLMRENVVCGEREREKREREGERERKRERQRQKEREKKDRERGRREEESMPDRSVHVYIRTNFILRTCDILLCNTYALLYMYTYMYICPCTCSCIMLVLPLLAGLRSKLRTNLIKE